MAKKSPGIAQRETWDWFKDLGASKAEADLAELFGLGTAPKELSGPTEGILVAPMIHPAVDAVARDGHRAAGCRGWARASTPSASAAATASPPAGASSPSCCGRRYKMTPTDEGNMAFDFDTRIEPGAIEPSPDVLVIDYADEPRNPELIIRKIRDELVEIVPHTHLGRILYRLKDGGYKNIGYFALLQRPGASRRPVAARARATCASARRPPGG